ncbi:MAG: FAD-dependent oxidoreductase [Lachnospiraceae bacterium]|nr:FAD-dependent oxidoreductase [Lachnospiraceae bacterium]
MQSIWSDTVKLPTFDPLKEEIKTDVLIIGGGIAGILCAYMLEQAGVDYVLVEADRICGGVSKNTTAKLTSQHGLIYHKLIRRFGVEKARMYLEANETALKEYRRLCPSMDCAFEEKDNFIYSISNPQKLEEEMRALEKIGFSATYVDELPLPLSTAGAVKFSRQAQFHPLKFLAGIAKGLCIFEHTKVQEMERTATGCTALTPQGIISAERVIVATHFPFINKHGSYFLKMYQNRSYVIALEGAQQVDGMYLDEAEKGLSFRNYGDLLLLGGGNHRTGKQGGNWAELEAFAKNVYPESLERYRWATQDCMTLDEVPYIGQYSSRTPGLYVATGFHKWGMTTAMAAAMILRDQIMGRENPYAPVFSPSRTILRKQLLVNAFEATTSLLTPTKKRCPHLGCALKWNPQEHSWDCPCHGSRFTEGGELIDNPATDDMKH